MFAVAISALAKASAEGQIQNQVTKQNQLHKKRQNKPNQIKSLRRNQQHQNNYVKPTK